MLLFSLDETSDEPMYQQIYSHIKKEILAGGIGCQEKLPSVRELAGCLSISRNPVDAAYEQLVAEGYVTASPKKGYFVNQITYTQQIPGKGISEEAAEQDGESERRWKYDFNPDAVDVSHFPYSVWKGIGRQMLDDPALFQAGDARGDASLRQAIASYLHGSRGVLCRSENIIVGAGMGYLLQLLSVLFREEGCMAFEEPGYVRAKEILSSNGFRIVNVPVCENGIDFDKLEAEGLNLCYLTPSHQFPLGTVMSIAQRQRILRWAYEREGRYVIEDDHDSEYRYKGKPIPALQSLDSNGRVIYIGTFSKSIGPALRMGYMVLPDVLMEKFQKCCGSYNCPVSRLDQAIVAAFIREGYFEKHLNRMRKHYKEKHDTVLSVFRKYHDKVCVSGDYAGLYVIAACISGKREEQILEEAEGRSMYLRPLSRYYASLPESYVPSFLIGFAIPDADELAEGLELLCQSVF